MFNKLRALWALFHQGEEIANAATWKNSAIAVNTLTSFFVAIIGIMTAWGYNIDISKENLEKVASGIIGIIGIYNAIMHTISSNKVGLSNGDRTNTKENDETKFGTKSSVSKDNWSNIEIEMQTAIKNKDDKDLKLPFWKG